MVPALLKLGEYLEYRHDLYEMLRPYTIHTLGFQTRQNFNRERTMVATIEDLDLTEAVALLIARNSPSWRNLPERPEYIYGGANAENIVAVQCYKFAEVGVQRNKNIAAATYQVFRAYTNDYIGNLVISHACDGDWPAVRL